jgi:hypothetical protein
MSIATATKTRRPDPRPTGAAPSSPVAFEYIHTVEIDQREQYVVVGGADDRGRYVELRHVDQSPAITAVWDDHGIVDYLRGDSPGTPVSVTTGGKTYRLVCRNGKLYDAKTDKRWRLPKRVALPLPLTAADSFSAPTDGTRRFDLNWEQFLMDAAGGAGTGAVVGGLAGGPPRCCRRRNGRCRMGGRDQLLQARQQVQGREVRRRAGRCRQPQSRRGRSACVLVVGDGSASAGTADRLGVDAGPRR